MCVYCEYIREQRRELCRISRNENPRLEDLRMLAFAPVRGAAWLKFSNAFDLESPTGYFQCTVMPRLERKVDRHMKLLMHLPAKAAQKAGAAEDGGNGGEPSAGGNPAAPGGSLQGAKCTRTRWRVCQQAPGGARIPSR